MVMWCRQLDLTALFNVEALDEFMSVSVPKRLIIQNRRIGLLYRVLQLAFAGILFAYCAVMESWKAYSKPTGSALVTWCPSSTDIKRPANFTRSSQSRHCTQPEAYHYQSSVSSDFNFKPNSCVPLAGHDSCYESDSELFLPTMIQDSDVWRSAGVACSSGHQTWCEGRSADARYDKTVGSCSCVLENQYFAESPESQQVLILHGYEVDLRGGHSDRLIRGSADSRSYTEIRQDKVKISEGDIITYIRTPSGEPCLVGGRSEWTQADAVHGIGGSLKEWLACAGVTLDMDPNSLKPTAAFPPHLRTMGLTLLLSLHYENAALDTFQMVYCTVTADIVITWTRRSRVDFTELPSPSNEANEALRTRIAYGVAVELRVNGRMGTYNIAAFVSFVVESIVIMQLPLYIVQFIALYCLGIVSEIYRSAKRTRLNIFEHFHSALSRMVLAEMGFRGLVGGKWKGSVAKMSLTESGLFQHLSDIFAVQIKTGVLQTTEVRKMVHITFRQLDTNGGGSISCNEFINSCLASEQITVDVMARFFDDDEHVGRVRKSLDSSWHHRSDSMANIDQVCLESKATEDLSESSDAEESTKEAIEDDGGFHDAGKALEQHKMKGFHPRRSWPFESNSSDVSTALLAAIQRLQTLEDADWGKRLAALEALRIESRLKHLESVNVESADISHAGSQLFVQHLEPVDLHTVDTGRRGSQLGQDEPADVQAGAIEAPRLPECCGREPTRESTPPQHGMPTSRTMEAAKTLTTPRHTRDFAEVNDLDFRVCKLDGEVFEMRETCEMRARQLMDALHRESAALTLESSRKLRSEVEDLRQRLDAAIHELSLRCQALERHYCGLARPAILDPSVVTASPGGQDCDYSPPKAIDQQNTHHCLWGSLTRAATKPVSNSLPSWGSRLDTQLPSRFRENMDAVSNNKVDIMPQGRLSERTTARSWQG